LLGLMIRVMSWINPHTCRILAPEFSVNIIVIRSDRSAAAGSREKRCRG
jgi:hypothetical protein